MKNCETVQKYSLKKNELYSCPGTRWQSKYFLSHVSKLLYQRSRFSYSKKNQSFDDQGNTIHRKGANVSISNEQRLQIHGYNFIQMRYVSTKIYKEINSVALSGKTGARSNWLTTLSHSSEKLPILTVPHP